MNEEQLRYGYWPSRELAGRFPPAIRYPGQYDGAHILSLACTQTALAPSAQRRLVREWCDLLPTLGVRTLLFRSRVNQDLFEAAVRIEGLEALFIKWSSIKAIDSIRRSTALQSLYIGDSPSLVGLRYLAELPLLRHLFVSGVREASDLGFAERLTGLEEFGISGGGTKQRIDSLRPLGNLRALRLLWLVNIRVMDEGLMPLHGLQGLQSLRTSMGPENPEVAALRAAVPGLTRFQPVWSR